MEPNRITVAEVVRRIDQGEPLVFVDARSPKSFGESDEGIGGAIRVPPDDVARNVAEVPAYRTVITFCT